MGETPGSGSRGRCGVALVACLLTSISFPPAASAQDYELVDLGVDVSPEDLNDSCTVVGSRQLAPGASTAFLYSPEDGSLRDLEGAVARAVNDSRLIARDTARGAFLLDGSSRPGFPDVSAWGINERGFVSGSRTMENPYRASPRPLAPALYDGTVWNILDVAKVYSRGTRKGIYADLYVLTDVNESGWAVGTKSRAGLYGSSAIMTSPAFDQVIYLPIPGGGRAAAINDANLVVGTTGESSSARTFAHAFLYDGTSVTDLGTLDGGLRSSASDINGSGQVVGASWLSTVDTSLVQPEQSHAFLWEDDGGGMRDLNDHVATPGWVLTSATAINGGGDIVGSAIVDGEVHGYLLATGCQSNPIPTSGAPPVAVASDVTKGRAPLTVRDDERLSGVARIEISVRGPRRPSR